MQGRRKIPPCQRYRIAEPGTEAVDEHAHDNEPDHVGKLKGSDDVAVLLGTEMQLIAHHRHQDGKHDAVQIVDSCGEE